MLKILIHSDYQIPEITRKLTLEVAATRPGWAAGGGGAVNTEPAVPGIGVDGCCRGYPRLPPRGWKAVRGPL